MFIVDILFVISIYELRFSPRPGVSIIKIIFEPTQSLFMYDKFGLRVYDTIELLTTNFFATKESDGR